VVDDHLVDPLAADLRNAGSPFDRLTARQAPHDAAFMSLLRAVIRRPIREALSGASATSTYHSAE
jgi:hypothetical protein